MHELVCVCVWVCGWVDGCIRVLNVYVWQHYVCAFVCLKILKIYIYVVRSYGTQTVIKSQTNKPQQELCGPVRIDCAPNRQFKPFEMGKGERAKTRDKKR